MKCKERSGFLFAHGCDQPVAGTCAKCGKSICASHTRQTSAGATCISCMKKSGMAASKIRSRSGMYDDPYWFAHHHFRDYDDFDERHYRAFDGDGPVDFAAVDVDYGAS